MKSVERPDLPSYKLFSPPAGETDDTVRKGAWKGDGFSFRDLIDIVNPLQHIPVVSSLYRWLTGDTIGNVPRIMGDALYGGPLGFLGGLVNAEIKQESGKDIGEQVIALVTGDQSSPAADPVAVAANDAASGSAQAAIPATAPPGWAVRAASRGAATQGGELAPSPDPADPRGTFLARAGALHRQVGGDGGQLAGRALSNTVIPLQSVAMPASFRRALPPAAVASVLGSTNPAGAAIVPANSAASLPSNPPVDISQQMMDALDKYTRLQQQRDGRRDATRGIQLDLVQ